MIDLSTYIYKLLNNHECVVIPSLGGFITRKKSAMIHANQNLFIPPSKHLIFNAQLTHNDGLLAHAVALDKNISYETALEVIDDAVEQILLKLYRGEEVLFESVGALTYQNGLLKFNPNQGINIQDENYGLNAFMTPLLQNEKYRRPEKIKAPRPKPVVKSYQVAAVMAFLILGLAAFAFYAPPVQDYLKSSLYPKILFHTANLTAEKADKIAQPQEPVIEKPSEIIAENEVVVEDTFVETDEFYEDDFSETEMAEETATEIATTPDVEAELIVETTQPEIVAEEVVINPETNNFPQTGMFYIIMGSFKSPELAEGFCAELRLKGYRGAEILDIPRSQYRYVSLQNYVSYKEAARCLKDVQDQMQTDAWLLTGK